MTTEIKNLSRTLAEDFATNQSSYLVCAADHEGFLQVRLQFTTAHLKTLRSMVLKALDEAIEASDMNDKMTVATTDFCND